MLPQSSQRFHAEHLSKAGAKAAESLGIWINRKVQFQWHAPELLAIEQAGEMLGQPDSIVPVCILDVHGPVTGRLVLVVDALTIASFVNSMMGLTHDVTAVQQEQIQDDASAFWDELAQSAALETANIVACSYLNALADALTGSNQGQLIPTPPRFVLDYAGSIAEFLLIDLPYDSPGVLLTQSRMNVDDQISSDWRLVWIPDTTRSREASAAGDHS